MTFNCAGNVAVKFGSGKKLSNDWPTGLRRDAGMMLPGNATLLLFGSRTLIRVPLLLKLLEKSPTRSSAVGVYILCEPPVTNWPVYSWDQKKKSRFLSVFQCLGMYTGPPMLYVSTLYRYGTRGVAAPFLMVWLFTQVSALNSSCR